LRWIRSWLRLLLPLPRYLVSYFIPIMSLTPIICVETRGVGANLLKVDSKKRRSKREIEEARAAELDQFNVMRSK